MPQESCPRMSLAQLRSGTAANSKLKNKIMYRFLKITNFLGFAKGMRDSKYIEEPQIISTFIISRAQAMDTSKKYVLRLIY